MAKPVSVAIVTGGAKGIDRERAGFVTGANFVIDAGMTRKTIYEE